MEVAVTAAWSSCTLESGSNGASAKLGQSASPSAVRPARSHTHIPLMPSCLLSYRYIIMEEKRPSLPSLPGPSSAAQINEHSTTKNLFFLPRWVRNDEANKWYSIEVAHNFEKSLLND